MRRRRRTTRGYILLEALIGGAVTFAALVGLFTQLAFAREQSLIIQREATAREVALREIENQRSRGFGAVGGCPTSPGTGAMSTGAFTAVTGLVGTYEMSVERTCVMERVTTAGALDVRHKLVRVFVRFPSFDGFRTVEIGTRVYDR